MRHASYCHSREALDEQWERNIWLNSLSLGTFCSWNSKTDDLYDMNLLCNHNFITILCNPSSLTKTFRSKFANYYPCFFQPDKSFNFKKSKIFLTASISLHFINSLPDNFAVSEKTLYCQLLWNQPLKSNKSVIWTSFNILKLLLIEKLIHRNSTRK